MGARASLFTIAVTIAIGTAGVAGAVGVTPPTTAAVARLQAEYGPAARVEMNPAVGTARLVVLPAMDTAKVASSPQQAVTTFVARYGELLGVADPAAELVPAGERHDPVGWTHLTYHQRIDGVEVFAATLRAHFDGAGRLRALNGFTAPATAKSTAVRPDVAPAIAMRSALTAVAKQDGRRDLTVGDCRLVLYHTGILRGVSGELRLAWAIEVRAGEVAVERVLVDAVDGRILERIALVHDITRMVGVSSASNIVWREGDPLPYTGTGAVADAEINTIITASKNTYDLFANLSGGQYLSYNGNDRPMISVWNADFVECPNALATGSMTGFCPGFGVDDVVGHEWTHNYTGATHGLIYQWQPGALNESYSDIFGEVVDQLNGIGIDAPATLRGDGSCSTFGGSPPAEATIVAPAELAGQIQTADAAYNPQPPWSVEAELFPVDDGVGVGSDGCEPPLDFPAGRIALVDRGSCEFQFKTATAEAAGAAGVVIVNLQDDQPISMGAGSSGGHVTIPSVSVGRRDGQRLREALAAGSVVLRLSQSADSESSVRWLIGEDNGALRDMWSPACAGDPARVLDSRYSCSDSDNGGVHTNSGVPNHTFALMVDGGAFNGHQVQPIGLTKAAHIYWRAMSVYQVPTTGFPDHAALLQQSCQDLIGADLTDLETGAVSAEHISAADCDQVAEAVAATELALVPSQCGFAPLLAPDAPALGGAVTLFEERFDGDPGPGWSRTHQGVYPEFEPRDWVWTDDVPAGGDGGSLYAVNDPLLGNCQPFDDDQSGVLRVTSPVIELPNRIGRFLVTLDHYVATEPGYDGGNIWLSVNGGSFRQIPANAFVFNPYNDRLLLGQNTNPLAGQESFTGTDDGVTSGSWGQSQIDLAGLATAGDDIQLRFEFGSDGCTGFDGWYLDRVAVELVPDPPRRAGGRMGNP